MKKMFLPAIALLALVCCKQAGKETPAAAAEIPDAHPNMAKARWFIGQWENKSAEGDLVENWKKENDSLYIGESYFIVKGDTVFAERVALVDIYGKMSYNVSVANQNEGEAIPFVMTDINDERVIFENPQHDYPSKIMYSKVAPDSLVAEISGTKEGKHASEIFRMKRKR
ncbi:DUF6265 family protein [Flavobacterium sp. RHBU_24]|uniref:DUF6265 family protein n=1 Tax=Flavobacterium sp. RHBU_24 TaxID=3391185 RepID=UPI00398470FE